MTIKNIVFCESSQQATLPDGNAITILVNPIVELNPLFVPSAYSFVVSFGACEIRETNGFDIILRFLDPQSNQIANSMISAPPVVNRNATCTVDFRNVPIREEGIYTLVIEMLGEQVCETINVRKQEQR